MDVAALLWGVYQNISTDPEFIKTVIDFKTNEVPNFNEYVRSTEFIIEIMEMINRRVRYKFTKAICVRCEKYNPSNLCQACITMRLFNVYVSNKSPQNFDRAKKAAGIMSREVYSRRSSLTHARLRGDTRRVHELGIDGPMDGTLATIIFEMLK